MTDRPPENHPDVGADRPDAMSQVTPAQLKDVLEVSRMLAVTSDLDRLLLHIAESTARLLNCERASIFLHDGRSDELWTRVALQSAEIRLPSGAGIVGSSFKSNRILHVPRPYEDPRFNPRPDRASGFVTRNILAVPTVDWERNPVGVIQAINKAGEFNPGDVLLLQLLADQVGVAIQRYYLQQSAVRSVALQKEMELAKDVQEGTMPRGRVTAAGWTALGWTAPASINGGDCFDLWELKDGRLGVLVADASGHGMAPALVVSQVRVLARVLCEIVSEPAEVLRRINERLAQDLDGGRFCTVFLGFISASGIMDWCSGGHGPVFLHRPGWTPRVIDATLPPLGILQPLPGRAPPSQELAPDERLIVPTDGILECQSPRGEMLGVPRVVEALASVQGQTLEQTLECLRTTVRAWQAGREPEDDQTAVVVARAP